jgi:hypothetical protein
MLLELDGRTGEWKYKVIEFIHQCIDLLIFNYWIPKWQCLVLLILLTGNLPEN